MCAYSKYHECSITDKYWLQIHWNECELTGDGDTVCESSVYAEHDSLHSLRGQDTEGGSGHR